MEHLIFLTYVIVVSGVFSCIEIQSEGKYGWAENFPTWKVNNRFTKLIWGGRPLTGYHFYFVLFIVLISHLPYGFGFTSPTLGTELRIISFIILFFLIEDFLWFVLNPAYGIMKFTKEHIWWHAPHWWWFMPRDYWIFTPIAITLYVLGSYLS
jgi:hypothetical protein